MLNKKKGFITKNIRFEDEKEMNNLISFIEGNYKDEAISLLIKIIRRGDLVF